MEQVYFLSIIGNTLAGLILMAEHLSEKVSFLKTIEKIFKNFGVRIILAFGLILIGMIKLVWPFNGIPFIGDLFPMLASLVMGFTLIFEFLRGKSDVNSATLVMLDSIFLKNKFYIGIAALFFSLLHFLLPWVVLF